MRDGVMRSEKRERQQLIRCKGGRTGAVLRNQWDSHMQKERRACQTEGPG